MMRLGLVALSYAVHQVAGVHAQREELLYNKYPSAFTLNPSLLNMEVNFRIDPILRFATYHYWLAPVCCAVYFVLIWLGQRYMENRPAYDLKYLLRFWDLLLCVLSYWGMMRIVPSLVAYVSESGFRASLCDASTSRIAYGPSGFWSSVFVFSKYFELVDTAFIILRKRNLSFLHWYHHSTVLLCSWFSFIVKQPAALYFCAMNYTVHSVMYFYYFVTSFMHKPPSWGVYVTSMQILQMLAGCFIVGIALLHSHNPPFLSALYRISGFENVYNLPCAISRSSLYACSLMYASYLFLFLRFFYYRYVKTTVLNKKHV